MGPGCTYLRGTKNYYTSSGWEPPSPNWSSRLLLKREVNSAVSVATSDASLGLRGRGPSPSCLAGRLRAGANSAVPSVRGVAPDSPSSQPITKTRDPKQETAAKSPSWESGDLGLSLAQPWAGSPRGVLLPLDLGLPSCTVGLSWTVPLDPRSRRSARTKPQTSAAGKKWDRFLGLPGLGKEEEVGGGTGTQGPSLAPQRKAVCCPRRWPNSEQGVRSSFSIYL